MSAPGPARAATTTRDDWETPDSLYRSLHEEFGFTLDAAATAENAKCDRFLTGPCKRCEGKVAPFCRCGHCASYGSETVFVNPPYGRGLDRWPEHWASSRCRSATIVALLPANTDTAWFANVYEHAAELRFLTGRVNFVGSTSGNTGGNVLAIYRPAKQGMLWPHPVMTLWNWRQPSLFAVGKS